MAGIRSCETESSSCQTESSNNSKTIEVVKIYSHLETTQEKAAYMKTLSKKKSKGRFTKAKLEIFMKTDRTRPPSL